MQRPFRGYIITERIREQPGLNVFMQNVIAIDGPSASGKSTLARMLADRLAIPCVNTGSMFRAVALAAQRAGVAAGDEAAVAKLLPRLRIDYCRNSRGEWDLALDGAFPGEALRTAAVAADASRVAAYPAVREALKTMQRAMAGRQWLVMEGRDIGSVIFPEAAFKYFITASPLERARRRLAQEGERAGGSLEEVAAQIAARDEADRTRAAAPLRAAADAVVIDNSRMSAEAVFNLIYSQVKDAVS